ncbi:MAG: acyltransferase [Actinomycetota bacterium]|nr:acyltransferase [Actinomycetota bacterium]
MEQTATGGTRPARLPVGDPLRGLACLAVVVIHAAALALLEAKQYDLARPPIDFRASFGALGGHLINHLDGVPVFFALSGYLIARPFAAWAIVDGPPVSIPGYLRNRALRILPAYWLVLAVIFSVEGFRGLRPWGVAQMAVLWVDWARSPFVNLLVQAWTLTIELRYYLVLPVVGLLAVALARRSGARPGVRVAVALTLLAAGALSSAAWISGRSLLSPALTLPYPFYSFAPGIALAVIDVLRPWEGRDPAKLRRLGLQIAVAGAVLFLTVDQFELEALGVHIQTAQALGPLALAAGAGAIVAGCVVAAWGGGGRWRVLDNPVLHWAGTRSYSIYLWHIAVLTRLVGPLRMGGHYERSTVALALAGLAVTLVLAECSFRLVERPFLKRKRAYVGTVKRPRTLRSRDSPTTHPAEWTEDSAVVKTTGSEL